MIWRRLSCLMMLVVVAMGSVAVGAQEEVDAVKERIPNHLRNRTKIRSGSMVHREQDDPPPPDLRGEYERRRDNQVIRHFTRLAELDAITKVALSADDTALAARAETVRRAENERFRLAMNRLRTVINHRLRTGLP